MSQESSRHFLNPVFLLFAVLTASCSDPQSSATVTTPESAPLPEGIANASIAVLPFADLDTNGEFGFFASGMQADVIAQLSRIEGLLVIARTSVQRYAEADDSPAEIAAALQVAHVLRGKVNREDARVSVTVELSRYGSDHPRWQQTFEGELLDVFAVQAEIARQVVLQLSDEIGPGLVLQAVPATADTRAYDWFVEGRELIRFPNADSVRRGLYLLRAAVERDPAYADAHAGLAIGLKALSSFAVPWEDVREQAVASARQGVELDAQSAYAAYALGSVLSGLSEDNKAAETYLQQAIALDHAEWSESAKVVGLADSFLAEQVAGD